MDLWADFLGNRGRLTNKWASYFPIYQRHFERFRNRPFVFIEIGCGEGGSLQMWRRYFGPFAQIVGLDVRPECKAFEQPGIQVRIGDQGDDAFLNAVVDEFGAPGIVLDDGSHLQHHVQSTFATLYPRVQQDGAYMVEDLHTAYWADHGGGLHAPGSFIQRCKGLVDEINGEWTPQKELVTDFTRSTMSMSFYNSVVVFEKGRLPPSASIMTGAGQPGT